MRDASEIQAIDSEAGVIASLIQNPSLSLVDDQLLPNHFYDKNNRCIYTAICELARRDIKTVDAYNIIEVLNASEATRKYADGLTVDGLQELIEMSPLLARNSAEEYKVLAHNVLDAAFRRDTFRTLTECQALCFDRSDPDVGKKIYEAIDSVMLDFAGNSELPEYKDIIDGIWKDIQDRQSGSSKSIEFVSFPALNEYCMIEKQEVVAVGAPTKGGKSCFLLTCCLDLLKAGHSVLYIDTELSTRLFTMRLLANMTGIPFSRIRAGNYGLEEKEAIEQCIDFLKSSKFFHIYTPCLDSNSLYLLAKRAQHLLGGLDVCILDYLKADTSKGEAFATYAQLGALTECYKNRVAGELGIAGLTACQLTASGSVADSARVARLVSTLLTITPKSPQEIQADGVDAGTHKLECRLNRNGQQTAPGDYLNLILDGNHAKYVQAPVPRNNKEDPY